MLQDIAGAEHWDKMPDQGFTVHRPKMCERGAHQNRPIDHKGILRGLFNEVHLFPLPTMSKTPASCGSRQSKASLSMPKSFSLGEIAPWVIHATSLTAATACGSAVAFPVAGGHGSASDADADFTADVSRDTRTMVTSLMFVLAKPMPAMVAKTKVASQTIHPASAVARWRACHDRAATEGMTSMAHLTLQLLSLRTSESMGNHDSNVMGGADSVD
jgi:hypothetical protein